MNNRKPLTPRPPLHEGEKTAGYQGRRIQGPWHRRHVSAPHRTTVKLEPAFWSSIELLADQTGHTWSEWVATELGGKPVGIGAASWLRVRCLIHSTQGA